MNRIAPLAHCLLHRLHRHQDPHKPHAHQHRQRLADLRGGLAVLQVDHVATVDARSGSDIDLREAAGLAGGLDCAAELGGRGKEDQLLGGGSGRSLISLGMG